MTAPVLAVRNLSVVSGKREVLTDVTFSLGAGESLGIIGSSGAGKSTLANAVLGVLPPGLARSGGSIRVANTTLDPGSDAEWRRVRGRHIGMIYQEPLLALDPVMRIGAQLAEAMAAHGLATGAEARRQIEQLLEQLGFPDPQGLPDRYPHELSGGMRQRALIAAAVLLEPAVLVADEPTTSLDVTVQAQVLDLLDDIRAARGMAVVLVSHDLDVVAERCARVLVLDGGRIVEEGAPSDLLHGARTAAGRTLAAAHRDRRVIAAVAAPESSRALLEVQGVSVSHSTRGAPQSPVRAVREVSFNVAHGEAVGIVGESGSGKSSLARAVLRLGTVSGGSVRIAGQDITAWRDATLRPLRKQLQYIPQDAGASLTPHVRVRDLVREGMEIHGIATGTAAHARVNALLADVGLPDNLAEAFPDEISAGERQRVAIARALAVEPALLVCDEPVASTDAARRGELLSLLDTQRRERGLALLLISHDLDAVRRVAARTLVMYAGRIVEDGPTAVVAREPAMPYTQLLLRAEPTGNPARRVRTGREPSALAEAASPTANAGCPFTPRCTHPGKDAQCSTSLPLLRPIGDGHLVACHKV